MNYYRLPLQIDPIWKLGKKYFQIWNALYYFAQIKLHTWNFEVTAYMFKTTPVLLTDMKKNMLVEYLETLASIDRNLSVEIKSGLKTERISVRIRQDISESFPVPVDLVERMLLKDKVLSLKTDIPGLFFVLMQVESHASSQLLEEPGFTIQGNKLRTFIKKLTGKRKLAAEVLEHLKNKGIISYFKLSDNDTYQGKITWQNFLNSQKRLKLKTRVGNLDEDTREIYETLYTHTRNIRGNSNADYLLIAGTLPRLIQEIKPADIDQFSIPDILGDLVGGVLSKQERGRYSLKNEFSKLLEQKGVITRWFDFSLDEGQAQNIRINDIPSINYSGLLINHCFYPGSLAVYDNRKLSFCINTRVKLTSDQADFNYEHQQQMMMSYSGRILNAYTGPFLCLFPRTAGKLEFLEFSINNLEGFKKLNLRLLGILMPGNQQEIIAT